MSKGLKAMDLLPIKSLWFVGRSGGDNMSSDGAEIKVTFPRAQGQKGLVAAQNTGFPFSVCSKLCYSLLCFRC